MCRQMDIQVFKENAAASCAGRIYMVVKLALQLCYLHQITEILPCIGLLASGLRRFPFTLGKVKYTQALLFQQQPGFPFIYLQNMEVKKAVAFLRKQRDGC